MFTKREQAQNSEHIRNLVSNLFSKKATDIIRVLLVNYPKTWMLMDLAQESGTALGYTSRVTNTLIHQRLALRASPRAELKIMAPEDLLKRWATYSNFTANNEIIEYYTREQDIGKFLNAFKCLVPAGYALTGLAGALLVAPFVRPTNTHVYIKKGSNIRELAEKLGLMPIGENGNVKFVIAPTDGVFYRIQNIDGIRVVSDIQLYIDLYNYPARGREASDELGKRIEKRWDEYLE